MAGKTKFQAKDGWITNWKTLYGTATHLVHGLGALVAEVEPCGGKSKTLPHNTYQPRRIWIWEVAANLKFLSFKILQQLFKKF